MLRRLPLRVIVSLLAVHVIALDVLALCATSDGHLGRYVTAAAAAALAFGATAALCERTWGVGLVLAAATSFFVAGALGMGPPFFFVVAAVGALPFLFTMKHMARFHVGATVLFALLAGAAGTTASLAWNAVAPIVLGR
ncbi:MAG: hypothetical protein KF850_06660 [Labilithrix sp.]|nr:hypothetical protein [Labilithrix sp.]MBX3211695.1 hypothetical protein [Labilithrix sp.]